MYIAFAGDFHGKLTNLYLKVEELESKYGVKVSWVLQTGNLGIWPDPKRLDRATRKNPSEVDFFRYYLNNKPVPRETIFIQGKHDDHRWLNYMSSRNQMEVLPNLNWLLNGYKTTIEAESSISIVGLGKVFSPNSYFKGKKKIDSYTRREVERACSQGPTDLLITHEAGKGAQLGNHLSVAEGINNICYAIRPKLHIHGHYNVSNVYTNKLTKTPTVSLAFGEVVIFKYNGEELIPIYAIE